MSNINNALVISTLAWFLNKQWPGVVQQISKSAKSCFVMHPKHIRTAMASNVLAAMAANFKMPLIRANEFGENVWCVEN